MIDGIHRTWLVGIVVGVLLLLCVSESRAEIEFATANSWTQTLQTRLKELEMNALQADQVVEMVNGFIMSHPERMYPERRWVEYLAQEVSSMMEGRVNAARALALQVERLYGRAPPSTAKIYNSLESSTWDAQFRSSLEFDDHYQRNVSTKFSTVRLPDFANQPPEVELWSQELDSAFRTNLASDPTLTNQYFGSTSGAVRTFPGGPWAIRAPPSGSSTTSSQTLQSPLAGFNARFWYWYVMGASGPKDIVLVIDQSDSMGNLYDVRKAAINVVTGLTSQDFVNIVTFNTRAVVASCWQDTLVRATDTNKQTLIAYLENLGVANGQTNIQAGLDLAGQILDRSIKKNMSSLCQQVVLLLTDGVSPVTAFKLDSPSTARVFAYVLNSYTDTSPLQRLTCATDGVLVPIPNPGSAYLTVGGYYEVLSPGRSEASPIWIGPYLDQYTEVGSVMTVVLPCFDRSSYPHRLIGVVGVDLPVADMEVLYSNFMTSPSYAYMVNNEGEAIIHPLLPSGASHTTHPTLFDIADLENITGHPQLAQVRRDLVHGLSGELVLNMTVPQPVGVPLHEGYTTRDVRAHIMYSRIPGSDLSVAIVWAKHADLPPHNASTPHMPLLRENVTHITPDLYHLTPPPDNSSSFSVAPRGYCNPVKFADMREDAAFSAWVVQSVDQPPSAACPNQLLRADARFDVKSTSHIDDVWNASLRIFPHVTWRFIATHHSGVLRTFPGRSVEEKFDSSSAPWYRRGVAHEGLFVASVPYLSQSGSGRAFSSVSHLSSNVVYFSKMIPYTISPSSVMTYGVMGMSLTYNELSSIFLNVVKGCTYDRVYARSGTRCMLMEGSGHLITHPLFLHTNPPNNKSYIFVGEEEPLLAESLASAGILVPVRAVDFSQGYKADLLTYTISDSNFTTNGGVTYATGPLVYSQDCMQVGSYYVSKFVSTNLYLVVLNITQSGMCAHRTLAPASTPTTPAPCDIEPGERGSSTCPIIPIPDDALNEVRGIQSCNSETHAILMGLLIPAAIGAAVVLLIVLAKRRRRSRSMRGEIMMPNEGIAMAHVDAGGGARIGPSVVGEREREGGGQPPIGHDEVSVEIAGPSGRGSVRQENGGGGGGGRRASHARSRSTNNLRANAGGSGGGGRGSENGRGNTMPRLRSNGSLPQSGPRNPPPRAPHPPSSAPLPPHSSSMFYDEEEGSIPMQMMSQGRAVITHAFSPSQEVELPVSERTESDVSSVPHIQLENDEGSEEGSMFGGEEEGEGDSGGEEDPDDPFGREMGLAHSAQRP